MLGAIAGDVIGSPYEHRSTKRTDFPLLSAASRFTDDTVLTVATAEALLGDGDYTAAYRRWGRRHPRAGYGATFIRWIHDPGMGPYDSWGNGSAMRVNPVGWALGDAEAVLAEAERNAAVSHDHPEGIRGAQAVALGGDADTQACIAGALAEAEGDVSADVEERVRHRLTPEMLDVLDRFRDRHARSARPSASRAGMDPR